MRGREFCILFSYIFFWTQIEILLLTLINPSAPPLKTCSSVANKQDASPLCLLLSVTFKIFATISLHSINFFFGKNQFPN